MTKTKLVQQQETLEQVIAAYKPLAEYVAIYVPSTTGINNKTNSAPYVEKTIREMAAIFGGVTSTKAEGAWYSDTLQELVVEEVTVVRSNTEKVTLEDFRKAEEIAQDLCRRMSQECVSLEVNGSLMFVSAKVS